LKTWVLLWAREAAPGFSRKAGADDKNLAREIRRSGYLRPRPAAAAARLLPVGRPFR
jgi:hypothetical protein